MVLRVALGQVRAEVGDISGNVGRILEQWHAAHEAGCDLIAFTELCVPGYPPEDLLLKPEFLEANRAAVEQLADAGPPGTVAVVGFVGDSPDLAGSQEPWDVAVSGRALRNSAAVLADGAVAGIYHKWRLPNYGVFDEARYFVPDDRPLVLVVGGIGVGITICEDLWTDGGSAAAAARQGASVVVNVNASPYHRGKRAERESWIRHHSTRDGTWILYCNVVGGQDDVVFDGDSMISSPTGEIVARGAQFAPDMVLHDLAVEPDLEHEPGLPGYRRSREPLAAPGHLGRLDEVEEVWEALVLATRDYVRRNGFTQAIVGLSGGIDSAVTCTVAADALGPENVLGVLLPSPFSSDHSVSDAESLADALGVPTITIPIKAAMDAFDGMLTDVFEGREPDLTEENVQARIRGTTLMALSNKLGALVLATGNKSEYAVGYSTLYGDMAGGFAPLKDVPKTLVYALAHHRNSRGVVIPSGSLTKPPSAELRPGQLDQDSLPPYDVLDEIVSAYIERDLGVEAITALGIDPDLVRTVVRMIDQAEFKRRQAAPGPKITSRAFGKERRVPITQGWRG